MIEKKIFESYLDMFVNHFIVEEGKKIKGYNLDDVSSLNSGNKVVRLFSGGNLKDIESALKMGKTLNFFIDSKEIDDFIPWWMEPIDKKSIEMYNEYEESTHYDRIYNLTSKFVVLVKNENKFYPIFHEFNYDLARDCNIDLKNSVKMKDGDKLSIYKSFLESKVETFIKEANKNGYGKLHSETSTSSHVVTKTRNETVPTGNYTVKQSYPGSDTYTLQQQTVTKEVKYSEVVNESKSYKYIVQYCWFTPVNEDEEKRFLNVLENQVEISKLAQEYSYLGIFDGKRKKEIINQLGTITEYTRLVIAKACVDRFENYHQDYVTTLNNCISIVTNKINDLNDELQKVAMTAFKKKKEINNEMKDLKAILKKLNRINIKVSEKIEVIDSVFKELNEQLANCLV